jgi:hypothetical protein
MKIRTLVAQQRYFGLEAHTFRAGAARALARMSGGSSEQVRFDTRTLAEDFRLDAEASAALLHALVAGGLLQADSGGELRPTLRFREYALARVVAPLPRVRAKFLVKHAAALAARINAEWARNPLMIQMVAVSGSYMSRRDKLPELTLWMVVRPRPKASTRRWPRVVTKSEGATQIAAALQALSSFIVVRLAVDRSALERPFSIVFQTDEDVALMPSTAPWERFREWGASISRRMVPGRDPDRRRGLL